jgi:hypothetical protein
MLHKEMCLFLVRLNEMLCRPMCICCLSVTVSVYKLLKLMAPSGINKVVLYVNGYFTVVEWPHLFVTTCG